MVASQADGYRIGARLRLRWFILCTKAPRATAHVSGGCDHSIWSPVSDAIIRSWLWSTATRSFPLGCFSSFLQVRDNLTTFCGSRIFTGRLLAIEDLPLPFSQSSIEHLFEDVIRILLIRFGNLSGCGRQMYAALKSTAYWQDALLQHIWNKLL